MNKYTIGVDFDTESARAVSVDVVTGDNAASSVFQYADVVIDEALPGSDHPLPPNWALQNPSDWLESIENTIPELLKLVVCYLYFLFFYLSPV